jgi:hypothetical protein
LDTKTKRELDGQNTKMMRDLEIVYRKKKRKKTTVNYVF